MRPVALKVIVTLAVLLLTSCATPIKPNQAKATFISSPPGATFSSGSEVWGVEPQSRIWTFRTERTTLTSNPITATWDNGVTVTHTIQMKGGEGGKYTFRMPEGAAENKKCIKYGFKENTEAFSRCLQNEAHANELREQEFQRDQQRRSDKFNADLLRAINPPTVQTDCTTLYGHTSCTSR